jgi:cell division protein FtsB
MNEELQKHNEILEFEIKNAQNSNDHIENFAREKLNLTYEEEEFISFKEENNKDVKDE